MELLFREDPYLKSCEATVTASGPRGVRLDRTVFYPTGGGQPGDCGDLVLPDGARLRVVDAVKGDGHEDVVHLLEEGAAPPAPGTRVTAEIDRSEEHTSELQSLMRISYAVFCLKKKKNTNMSAESACR